MKNKDGFQCKGKKYLEGWYTNLGCQKKCHQFEEGQKSTQMWLLEGFLNGSKIMVIRSKSISRNILWKEVEMTLTANGNNIFGMSLSRIINNGFEGTTIRSIVLKYLKIIRCPGSIMNILSPGNSCSMSTADTDVRELINMNQVSV